MAGRRTPPKPKPYASDHRGRGTTLERAIDDGIRKKGSKHGDVLHVDLWVTVSNPHVGEYIVDLD